MYSRKWKLSLGFGFHTTPSIGRAKIENVQLETVQFGSFPVSHHENFGWDTDCHAKHTTIPMCVKNLPHSWLNLLIKFRILFSCLLILQDLKLFCFNINVVSIWSQEQISSFHSTGIQKYNSVSVHFIHQGYGRNFNGLCIIFLVICLPVVANKCDTFLVKHYLGKSQKSLFSYFGLVNLLPILRGHNCILLQYFLNSYHKKTDKAKRNGFLGFLKASLNVIRTFSYSFKEL